MSAPWVSVMRLGNLQLECGLWASFQTAGSPFFLRLAAIRAPIDVRDGARRAALREHGDPAYSSLARLRQLQTTAVEPALSGAGGGIDLGLSFWAEHSFWAEPTGWIGNPGQAATSVDNLGNSHLKMDLLFPSLPQVWAPLHSFCGRVGSVALPAWPALL
ncbi:MAG: hypothetical protein WCA20_14815 [Candidatus Sulfotelmatobacter sp.]